MPFLFADDEARRRSAAAPGHAGFVAGHYRSGATSDAWTDARRCADGTFTHYLPACTCGWRGRPRPVDEVGWMQCRRDWLAEHAGAPSNPAAAHDRREWSASARRPEHPQHLR